MRKLLLWAGAAMSAVGVQAQTIEYTGANNGDWFTPANWTPQHVPTADDDVTIPAGKIVKAQTAAIAAKSLTITGSGAQLVLGAYTNAPQTIATISGDLTVTSGAKLYVYAGALTDLTVFSNALSDISTATAAIYANPTVVSVGGTFTVSGGATVYPANEMKTGAAVFFKPVNFTLADDGTIDTRNRGWYRVQLASAGTAPAGAREEDNASYYYYTYAFGPGHGYAYGAGYGGKALQQTTVTVGGSSWKSGESYGSAYAPFLSGSISGNWAGSFCRASGSIVVLATGTVTLNGTLNADGNPVTCDANGNAGTGQYTYAAVSGGGIWVCGQTVTVGPAAVLTAKGANVLNSNTTSYKGAGGGGRICVCYDVGASDWATFAVTTALPTAYISASLLDLCPGASVAGGRINFGNSESKAEDGTAAHVTGSDGNTFLTVLSEPAGTIAEGVSYGTFIASCAGQLSYSAANYGYDVNNPNNVRYSRAGWTLTDKDNATAASGDSSPAQFTLTQANGPYTLTWNWNNQQGRRQAKVNGAGTVTANGEDPSTDVTIWGSMSGEGVDTLVATAASGSTFVGWFGVPGGKSTSASIAVPRTVGACAVAVFAKDEPTLADKTWSGGTAGSWDDAANWSPSGVPTLESDVKVTSGTCFAPQGAVANSITVSSGAKFALAASGAATDPVADTSDKTTSRFLYLADDFACAGTALFGAENAIFTNLWLEVGGDFALTATAQAEVSPVPCVAAVITTNALYQASTVFKIGGALSLADTSLLYARCDRFTGTAVRFEPATLNVAINAKISADSLGWGWLTYTGSADSRALRSGSTSASANFETCSFGAGYNFTVGGGHAYAGNRQATVNYAGLAYGFANAPFLPGSPNGVYNSTLANSARGGGVVWVKCSGEATVNGIISANSVTMTYGGPSGGSIWLSTTGLSAGPDASFSANGGGIVQTYNYTSAGAGGRICLALGVSDEDIATLATGVTPAGVTVTEGIALVTATVNGGTQKTGAAPDGTLITLSGAQANVTVNVAGSPLQAIGPDPDYGAQSFAPGSTVTFTATADGHGYDPADPANIRYTCAGYVVTDTNGATIASGDTASFQYEIPSAETTVTWFWKDKETALHAYNPQGETFGALKIGGVSYPTGGIVWCLTADTVTVEAVPAEGHEFLYWRGEFPYGQAKVNPVSLPTAKTRTVMPVFRVADAPTTRTWNGTASGIGVSNLIKLWMDPNNWTPANIPGIEDDVVFPQTANSACFATNNYIEVKSLTIAGDIRLWIGAMSEYSAHYFIIGEAYFRTRVTEATEEIGLVVTGDLVMSNTCEISVGAPNQKTHDRVLVAGDLKMTGTNRLQVVGGVQTETFTFARGASEIAVGGAFNVGLGSTVYLASDRETGGSVVIRANSLTVDEQASITADRCGFGFDPAGLVTPQTVGKGWEYSIGGGYGGYGRALDVASYPYHSDTYGLTYGNEYAPIHPGSGSGKYQTTTPVCGGGLIRAHAKSMTINGRLTADAPAKGETGYTGLGAPSGGGIWLTANNFAFGANARLSAKGGDSNYTSEGGGGRIAIGYRLTDDQISTLATTGDLAHSRKGGLSMFFATFSGLTAANVNVSGGTGTGSPFTPHPEVTDGTFRFVGQSLGLFIILK